MGGTICALPKVLGCTFSTVPKRVKGDLVPNPAYDEEVFKALFKREQTSKRRRMHVLLFTWRDACCFTGPVGSSAPICT